MKIRNCLKCFLYFISGGWIILLLLSKCDKATWDAIVEDYYCACGNHRLRDYKFKVAEFMVFIIERKPYRNVFKYRCKDCVSKNLMALYDFFVPPLQSIELSADKIGPGLIIPHNYLVCGMREAGKHMQIQQGVTIGTDGKTGKPYFGDNVWVGANAIVIGNIHIGDNVKIGAGTVVNKDIPSNCTVVGNPFRIIFENEKI